MDTESFTAHTFAHCTGTTVLHLSKDAIPSFKFILPSQKLMTAFSETVSSLSSQQIRRVHENDSLAATRDLLLPKLMSGEIRVRDAEKGAEAAQ